MDDDEKPKKERKILSSLQLKKKKMKKFGRNIFSTSFWQMITM